MPHKHPFFTFIYFCSNWDKRFNSVTTLHYLSSFPVSCFISHSGQIFSALFGGRCSADGDCIDLFNTCDAQSVCSCSPGYTYQSNIKTCKGENFTAYDVANIAINHWNRSQND